MKDYRAGPKTRNNPNTSTSNNNKKNLLHQIKFNILTKQKIFYNVIKVLCVTEHIKCECSPYIICMHLIVH